MTIDRSSPLLPFGISICGLDELAGYADYGASHVVSILDPDWPDPPEFGRYRPHRRTVFRFHDVTEAIPGVTAPAAQDVAAILDLGSALLADGAHHLLVHCHAGISRSTATAAILMAQSNASREHEVFFEIARVRPRNWPNRLMVQMADDLLNRDGALIAALRVHQRRMAESYADFAELLRRSEMACEAAE